MTYAKVIEYLFSRAPEVVLLVAIIFFGYRLFRYLYDKLEALYLEEKSRSNTMAEQVIRLATLWEKNDGKRDGQGAEILKAIGDLKTTVLTMFPNIK